MRHHKKEKKYGPGPSNNYTSGKASKTPFWKRNKKHNRDTEELGVLGAGSAAIAEEKHHKKNKRISDETGMTGSTAAAADAGYGGTNNKYAESALPVHHNNAGYVPYDQQQTGTAVTTPGATYGGYGHSSEAKVVHDANPYAEVHNEGFVHRELS